MTALDVKHAKRALAWRLGQWGVQFDIDGKAGSFIDDLVSQGWQMAPERESRPRPPKQGEQCQTCNRVMHDDVDPVCDRPTRPDVPVLLAGRPPTSTYLEAKRAALGLAPEPSPAPGVGAPVPAVDDAAAHPGREPQDVQQRAGEPDRPETACAALGCFRPTTDGICDRCRATAAAEDVQAANAELVERLHANEAERARNRPPADPAPPRYFTSADYDPERVHAAQAQRTDTYRAAKTALNGADHE